jgi:hypothetical protein
MVTPITPDVLVKSGVVTDSLAPRTYQALKLLDLTDEQGQPTTALKELATAPGPEFKERLAAVIRGAYAPIFSFADPAVDRPERIRDAFRGYEPRGQQERMVILFYGLCEFAGIIEGVPKRAASPPSQGSRPGKTEKLRDSAMTGRKDTPISGDFPVALQGLLQELAAIGPTWTQDRKEQFLAVFNVVLNYSYPAQADRAGNRDDDDGGGAVT